MEVLSHSIDEGLLDKVKRFWLLLLLEHDSNILGDGVSILRDHQIWNFTSVQHIVDVFEEGFVNDLTVCQGKDCRLALLWFLLILYTSCREHDIFNELFEVISVVILRDFNLAELHRVHR